jgi:hypothetical protein
MGLNAIGRGLLTVEDSTLYGRHLVSFRGDYGSTWQGRVAIRNCRWVPAGGERAQPYLIGVTNDGMHDFGYPCSMPEQIDIDGLVVDDANVPAEYGGIYLFTDPDAGWTVEGPRPAQRPFPYAPARRVTLRRLQTASGRPPRVSPSPALNAVVEVVEG